MHEEDRRQIKRLATAWSAARPLHVDTPKDRPDPTASARRLQEFAAQFIEESFRRCRAKAVETFDFSCNDCGVNTFTIGEYYMVTDEIWASGGLGDGYLCIGCLESRLGRRLIPNDFTDALCNRKELLLHEPHSAQLKDRMGK